MSPNSKMRFRDRGSTEAPSTVMSIVPFVTTAQRSCRSETSNWSKIDLGPGDSGEELAPHTDIEAVVEQRERIVESGFEIGLGGGSEVVDAALIAAFEEFEERLGQVHASLARMLMSKDQKFL